MLQLRPSGNATNSDNSASSASSDNSSNMRDEEDDIFSNPYGIPAPEPVTADTMADFNERLQNAEDDERAGMKKNNRKLQKMALNLKFSEMMDAMNKRFDALENKFDKKIDNLGKKVDKLDKKVDKLDKKVDNLDKKVDNLDKKVDNLDKKVDHLDKKVDHLDKKVDHLDKKVEYNTRELKKLKFITMVNDNRRRLGIGKSCVTVPFISGDGPEGTGLPLIRYADEIPNLTRNQIVTYLKGYEIPHPPNATKAELIIVLRDALF